MSSEDNALLSSVDIEQSQETLGSQSQLSQLPIEFDEDIGTPSLSISSSTSSSFSSSSARLSLFKSFQRIVQNELHAPELLTYEQENVSKISTLFTSQQDVLDEYNRSPSTSSIPPHFIIRLYEIEIERIKYMYCQYHRCRIQKIQKYPIHILQHESLFERLNPFEQTFLKNYVDALETHLTHSFLAELPAKFQSLVQSTDQISMVPSFDTSSEIVFRVDNDIGTFALDEGDETELNKGDIVAAPYHHFTNLLEKGQISLI